MICGDSTDVAVINKLMDGSNANLLLTDPPYGISIVSNDSVGGSKPATFNGTISASKICEVNKYMPVKGDESTDSARLNYEAVKSLTDNQIIFGGNYFTDFLFPSSCWLVWDKKNGDNNFADCELAWTSFKSHAKVYPWMWNGMARQGDRKTEGVKRVHPTQKPVGLLADIIRDFSEPGDIVLDCFGGSGSTLIACEATGRECRMIEFEPYYCDVIINRWENFTGQKAEQIK